MNNIWYHGTTATAAENIIRTGKFRVQDEEGRAFYVSRPGKVYISRDVGVGIQHGDSRVKMGFDDRFGVLELKLKDPSAILPDELEFGFLLMRARRDHMLTKDLPDRDDWEYIEDDVPEFPYSTGANIDEAIYIYKKLENKVSDHIWNAIDGMSSDDMFNEDIGANTGDDIIDYLQHNHPDVLKKMINEGWFYNYTTKPSNAIITGGWTGTLADFQRPMSNVFTDTGELNPHEIYPHMKIRTGSFPIQARGRGWFGEPQRHALAARGVRTR